MVSQRGEDAIRDADDKEGAASAQDRYTPEALQDEFHQVWEDTIKPALEQLKLTTEELLNRFSDFEDDFRGYLRDRQPDVDVELLEEIYDDTIRSKEDKREKQDKEA